MHDYTRREAVACLERARDLVEMAQFWASLEDHKHDEDEYWNGICESELCLEAWRMYPDG